MADPAEDLVVTVAAALAELAAGAGAGRWSAEDLLARAIFELEPRVDQCRATLLARMSSGGIARVVVPHVGLISFDGGRSTSRIDAKKLSRMFEEACARLRALGQEVDDSLPLGYSVSKPGIRVQRRPADWTGSEDS